MFTAAVQWHLTATCTTSGPDYAITLHIYQPVPSPIGGTMPGHVGQDVDFTCNGQSVDSNQSNPGGFPPGTYTIQAVTGGNWTITVLAE
jgi:hypothetical protein